MISGASPALRLYVMVNDSRPLIAIIGMGYVGLSLAKVVAFAGLPVRGIDSNIEKVLAINGASSPLVDVSSVDIENMLAQGFVASNNFEDIRDADVIVLALPTPVGEDHQPDLGALRSAVRSAAPFRRDHQLWILESTVLPGVTEEVILSELLSTSFDAENSPLLAYSPERVNPGSSTQDLTMIPKVVAGIDDESLAEAVSFYTRVGFEVVPAASIREAEAAKLLENTYRAVNMALVNDLAQQFSKAGIDFLEVVRLAETKPFGFEAFWPGPGVGGHCIPVDPWYLQSYLRLHAKESAVTAVALEVNRKMPHQTARRVADIVFSEVVAGDGPQFSMTVMGMSYKKDVNDFRESPGPTVVKSLLDLGISVSYHDPFLSAAIPGLEGASWIEASALANEVADTVLILQEHSQYLGLEDSLLRNRLLISAAPGAPRLGKSIWAPRGVTHDAS